MHQKHTVLLFYFLLVKLHPPLCFSGTERLPTSTWCEIRRRANPKDSVSCAMRIKGAPFWLWITLMESRWRAFPVAVCTNGICYLLLFITYIYIYILVNASLVVDQWHYLYLRFSKNLKKANIKKVQLYIFRDKIIFF